MNVTGSMAGTLGEIQPFRYRGYVYDVETELYYLRSRYYNPQTIRFVNSDSIIDGINLYEYCESDGINLTDTDGMAADSIDSFTISVYTGKTPEMMAQLEDSDDYYYNFNGTGNPLNKNKKGIPICCSYAVFQAREKKGHTGPDLIYRYDTNKNHRGRIKDLISSGGTLKPGMLVFRGNDKKKTHVGIVVLHDFGDGKGPVLAVFHSTRQQYSSKWNALFHNDKYGGPNITSFSKIGSKKNIYGLWKYYGVVKDD